MNKMTELLLYQKEELANELGITLRSFYMKIKNPNTFTYEQVKIIEKYFKEDFETIIKDR